MATDKELEKLQRQDHDTLIRLETKMDALVTEMRSTNTNSLAVSADHEARIRVLEVDKDKHIGASSGAERFRTAMFAILGLIIAATSVWALLHKS